MWYAPDGGQDETTKDAWPAKPKASEMFSACVRGSGRIHPGTAGINFHLDFLATLPL